VEKKSHYNGDDCVRVGGVTDVQGQAMRRHNKSGGLGGWGVASKKNGLYAHGCASGHILAAAWFHIGLMM
jgi:hypothetical protein